MQIFLISILLLALALSALAVRLFLVKDGRFSGGSCRNLNSHDRDEFSCACGSSPGCASEGHS